MKSRYRREPRNICKLDRDALGPMLTSACAVKRDQHSGACWLHDRNTNIMIFEFVYKIVIVMIDINDALRKLNVLNSKKSKDNIDKLINLIGTNQKTNKSFSSKTAFASSVLSIILIQITSEKIIESFIEVFKIMHFNNA